ncbi:hypothetical protein [Salipiger mangrovisoli]|uniref:Lipoprotein n=1 Tax=Salipiger mangrovisoli TaxID=2865933 RepID=A0ABR9X2I0_9RHOB|nr:hypothetical protein [Salipiger mangrovisoli]MBE9637672.1 hypothetical protein [Salipiger mangrovisoli]
MTKVFRTVTSLAALAVLSLTAACLPQEETASSPVQETGIPMAMQGRWGLVPADCTSTRGDAKGLMEVSAERLGFYESRAVLAEVSERSDTRLAASFDMTGEGMSWQRDMVLVAKGDTLVRQESGEGAIPGPLTYQRCD